MRSAIAAIVIASCAGDMSVEYATTRNGLVVLSRGPMGYGCTLEDDAVMVLDRSVPVLLGAARDGGFVAPQTSLAGLSICVVGEPMPCCYYGSPCVGPCSRGRCARKAGCSMTDHAWASRSWPPICDGGWKDEPHCSSRADASYDWRATLVHEVANALKQRDWSVVPYSDLYYADGGPVATAIMEATRE